MRQSFICNSVVITILHPWGLNVQMDHWSSTFCSEEKFALTGPSLSEHIYSAGFFHQSIPRRTWVGEHLDRFYSQSMMQPLIYILVFINYCSSVNVGSQCLCDSLSYPYKRTNQIIRFNEKCEQKAYIEI